MAMLFNIIITVSLRSIKSLLCSVVSIQYLNNFCFSLTDELMKLLDQKIFVFHRSATPFWQDKPANVTAS